MKFLTKCALAFVTLLEIAEGVSFIALSIYRTMNIMTYTPRCDFISTTACEGGAPLPAKPKAAPSGPKGDKGDKVRELAPVYDFSSLSPADLDKRMKNPLALAQGEEEALAAEKARRAKATAPAPAPKKTMTPEELEALYGGG